MEPAQILAIAVAVIAGALLITALVLNYKGKAIIYVNVWDMLLCIVAAILVIVGCPNGSITNPIPYAIGNAIIIGSIIWTIVASVRCHINFWVILLSIVTKIFFLSLFLILACVLLVFRLADPVKRTETNTYQVETRTDDGDYFVNTYNVTTDRPREEVDYEIRMRDERDFGILGSLGQLFISRIYTVKRKK